MAALRLAIAPALSLALPWAVLRPGRSGVYLRVAPLGTRWCKRYRRHLLLRALRGGSVARLVAVVAAMQRLLLLDLGIPISRVLPLIDRQRGRRRYSSPVPMVPTASALRPLVAPMLAPARRCIALPATEICRWIAVVAHRNAQYIHRHGLRAHQPPGAVVPGTAVPVVLLIDPVDAVVEEEVRLQARCVVH